MAERVGDNYPESGVGASAKADPGVPSGERLFSLDVYRGLVMTLLIAEGAGVYVALHGLEFSWAKPVAEQFMHPAWEGLTFWDLIQPAFMFIVGVAMVFSMRKRAAQGQDWARRFGHILKRCVILLLLGMGLHCLYAGELVFELWNVLAQLSVTILIAFLIMRFGLGWQLLISLLLIVGTDLAYRVVRVSPYDQPFVPGQNLGAYVDMLLMGRVNSDHWVALNAIPSAAHTIWGVIAGRLLIEKRPWRAACWIALFGVACVLLGFVLDQAGYAPIIKRTCTGPFVLISGGLCLVALSALYTLNDIYKVRAGGWVFAVVGTNPILIYLIAETLAHTWLNPRVYIFVGGAFEAIGVARAAAEFCNALFVWLMLWGLCYWLYRHKAFVRV